MSRMLVFAYRITSRLAFFLTYHTHTPARAASAIAAFLVIGMAPSLTLAQNHAHGASDRGGNVNELVRVVREATERFKDVAVAESEEYHLMFGCVTGDYSGAMGLHYVNADLVFDGGELDPTRPEIVLYEPTPSGRLRITGADFLVIAEDWDTKYPMGPPPALMGQLFHRFEAPNRFGLPAFYTLHVWAWKESPTGTFVNWHENISCDGFKGQ